MPLEGYPDTQVWWCDLAQHAMHAAGLMCASRAPWLCGLGTSVVCCTLVHPSYHSGRLSRLLDFLVLYAFFVHS